ncbi:unnamed protein product [Allacma fusca]|uniref:Secreted protein n=1 Tax=Allacma fusca TaxID=39272 RepID=A0A8J2KJ22_9HEXA|nr:unnamed protein product [Allacma fusca]
MQLCVIFLMNATDVCLTVWVILEREDCLCVDILENVTSNFLSFRRGADSCEGIDEILCTKFDSTTTNSPSKHQTPSTGNFSNGHYVSKLRPHAVSI